MAGNRFNRMPTTSSFMDAFNRALGTAEAANNAQMMAQISQLDVDLNRLAAAVEQELLKMSHKIDEDDSISVSDQIAWFMNSS
jgi:hypothetical protein|tara:strand:+ start:175 stop:423 length:249 start_codon:yes stop_codon:yes gene_type:complete